MKCYVAILTLTGLMSGEPHVSKHLTVEPGKQAQVAIGIPLPAAGDWIDVLSSTPDILIEIIFPDGRQIKDLPPGEAGLALRSEREAGIDDAGAVKRLLPQGAGQHHILSLPEKPPAGEYQIRLDGRQAKVAAHITIALIRLADIKQMREQSDADGVLQRRVDLAEKARQRNDTEEELKQLLPALERAIQLRSLEWIENIAGLIERAYRDIDQSEKSLEVLKRAAAAIRSIAGPESIRAAEFEAALAMTYIQLERFTEARTALAEAARKIRKAAGPDSVVLKQLLEAQALMGAMAGNEELSSGAAKEAEAIEERRRRKNDFGFPPDAQIAQLLEQARTASAKKDNAEVDRLIGQVTIAAESLDVNNPQRSRAWWEAAIVYNSPPVGRPDLVDKYLMKSLELSEAALGGKPISDVMRLTLPMVHLLQFTAAVYTLSGSCGQPGRAFACVALSERCIAVYERALGPNHPAVGGRLGELGNTLYFTASQEHLKKHYAGVTDDVRSDPRIEKALAYRRRELSIYEQAFGKDDPWLADTVRQLADIYQYKNDLKTARALRDRAESLSKAGPPESEEDRMKYQARQLRLLLRFDEADELVESYRTRYPESSLKE